MFLFFYISENCICLAGEDEVPEEGIGEQADNEPDSEDAAPKGGVNINYFY